MSVAIFGAGMAGCTVAHLLCTKGYKVHLFEASSQIGGFVKTFRNKDGIPQEHSPRIVLNDYHLMERIFKDLNIEKNLIDDSNFEDTIFPLFGKPHSSILRHDGIRYQYLTYANHPRLEEIFRQYGSGLKILYRINTRD